MKKRNEEISYEWCQYLDDVRNGLWTIRAITKRDKLKVFSQAEAEAYCKDNNK